MAELSIIFPIHNEEKILTEQTQKVLEYLDQNPAITAFEILLCPNGCADRTEEIAKQLAKTDARIRTFPRPERGIGVGLREGIVHSRYEYGMFYAIDLPFGLNIIVRSLADIEQFNADLVIGSKAHPDSILSRTFQRRLFTAVLRLVLNLVFRLRVGDTQGSLFWRQSRMRTIMQSLTSDTAFFETQIVIYFRAMGYAIREIPVTVRKELRSTRIPVIRESVRIIKEIFSEKLVMRRHIHQIEKM